MQRLCPGFLLQYVGHESAVGRILSLFAFALVKGFFNRERTHKYFENHRAASRTHASEQSFLFLVPRSLALKLNSNSIVFYLLSGSAMALRKVATLFVLNGGLHQHGASAMTLLHGRHATDNATGDNNYGPNYSNGPPRAGGHPRCADLEYGKKQHRTRLAGTYRTQAVLKYGEVKDVCDRLAHALGKSHECQEWRWDAEGVVSEDTRAYAADATAHRSMGCCGPEDAENAEKPTRQARDALVFRNCCKSAGSSCR